MKAVVVGCRIGLGTAAIAVLSILPAGGAHALACGTYPALACPPPQVTHVEDRQTPAVTTDPNARVERAVSASTLAFTGTDVVELSGIGLGAIGLGLVLVRRGRTRQSSD